MKKYIGARELAARWGVTERRIRLMCQEGRIEGAVKLGWSWSIPADVPKPFDGRHMRVYKNSFVRLGSIDIDRLNSLRDIDRLKDLAARPGALDGILGDLLLLGIRMDGGSAGREGIMSAFPHLPSLRIKQRNYGHAKCIKTYYEFVHFKNKVLFN